MDHLKNLANGTYIPHVPKGAKIKRAHKLNSISSETANFHAKVSNLLQQENNEETYEEIQADEINAGEVPVEYDNEVIEIVHTDFDKIAKVLHQSFQDRIIKICPCI